MFSNTVYEKGNKSTQRSMRRKIRVLFIVSSTILKDCKSNNVLFTFSIYTEESTEATSVSGGKEHPLCWRWKTMVDCFVRTQETKHVILKSKFKYQVNVTHFILLKMHF